MSIDNYLKFAALKRNRPAKPVPAPGADPETKPATASRTLKLPKPHSKPDPA